MIMEENIKFQNLTTTLSALLNTKNPKLYNLLQAGDIDIDMTDYDNWNGGINIYTIYLNLDVNVYSTIEGNISEYESALLNEFQFLIRDDEHTVFSNLIIKPVIKESIAWDKTDPSLTKEELTKMIERLKSIMISVSTGGPKINTINDEYIHLYNEVDNVIKLSNLKNPNIYNDLWKWYGKWSSGDLPSYQSRREFISSLYTDLLTIVSNSSSRLNNIHHYEVTGWNRVDRSISELRKRMNESTNEEQFQTIGLLARETLVSLAQEVYNPTLHKSVDDIDPSSTDAKRMLEAFISSELPGSKNELLRRHVKSTLALANYLTHKRTATRDDAALCSVSVMSLINIIKIISKQNIIYF